jgi:hypothetical protein
MKFATVGDSVKGTYKESFAKKWDGIMPDQIVYTLVNATTSKLECNEEWDILSIVETEAVDGEINIWVKESNSFLLQRLKNVKPGDIIWFAFTREIKPKTKGHHPAKSIQIFKSWIDAEFVESLVKKEDEINIEDIPF